MSGPTLSRPSAVIDQERIDQIQREQTTRANPPEHATQAEKKPYKSSEVLWAVYRGDHVEVVGPIFPPVNKTATAIQINPLRLLNALNSE